MTLFSGRLSIAAAALFASLVVSAPVVAQEKGKIPAPAIAVIDLDRIMVESAAAKSVRASREKYQQQFQADVTKEENGLRASEQDLAKQRSTLAPEAFSAKAKEFEQQVAKFQRSMQDKRRALDASYGQAMSQVQKVLVQVTADLAQESGANAVMLKSQLFLFDPKMDITSQAIERLNKKLATVEFPIPQLGQGDAKPAAKTKK